MRYIKYDLIVFIAFLIIGTLVYPYLIKDSNQDSRFSGNSDSFNIVNIVGQNNIEGQVSEIYFHANTIILKVNSPDLTFRSIKNITIENYNRTFKEGIKTNNYRHTSPET